jgi:hypothetical protein
MNTVVTPYLWVIRSKTYCGHVKPQIIPNVKLQIIPNATYNMIYT